MDDEGRELWEEKWGKTHPTISGKKANSWLEHRCFIPGRTICLIQRAVKNLYAYFFQYWDCDILFYRCLDWSNSESGEEILTTKSLLSLEQRLCALKLKHASTLKLLQNRLPEETKKRKAVEETLESVLFFKVFHGILHSEDLQRLMLFQYGKSYFASHLHLLQ